MQITASIKNGLNSNEVAVSTNSQVKTISIPSKPDGSGSAINGGELLLLSLAVCYCNDIYREAAKRKLKINSVEVEVSGEFAAEGEPGKNFRYKPVVHSNASASEIQELIAYTDGVAEIHKTLRNGINVELIR